MFQHVSNAGIILCSGKKRIGIDCFCRDSSKLYQDTPAEVLKKIKPDVLIFTHAHEDHFCAEYVKEAWENHPKLQVYGGEKVIQILEKLQVPSQNLNVIQDGDVLEEENLKIEILQSTHEGEQYADVQNLTLLINKEDKHLVITGDAMPCRELFERISEWSSRLDWFFAPFPYVGLRSTRKLLVEYLNIRNIFVLHLPRKEADTQNWEENTKRVCEVARDALPEPIFPKKLGQRYCM